MMVRLPTVSVDGDVKVAIPATALTVTVGVPLIVTPAGLPVMARVTGPVKLVTRLLLASRIWTVTSLVIGTAATTF